VAESSATILVRPKVIRSGLPITVDVSDVSAEQLLVQSKTQNVPAFEVPLVASANGHSKSASLTLDLPGTYEFKAGSLAQTIEVQPQVFLPFSIEFGIVFSAIFIFVGGLGLWMSKRRKILR
jgi:hypothetical protein